MKYKLLGLGTLMLFTHLVGHSQERRKIALEEIIRLASTQSTEARLSDTKIESRRLEVKSAKNSQLPEAQISGQYMLMTTPDINFKIPLSESGEAPDIKANQLILGRATVNMPIYTGGKIMESIHASENALKAEQWTAQATKEQLAKRALSLYLNLYKAQQTTLLIEENIKRATQRVMDFKAMETNGVIARNDLLKAELQLSNYLVAQQEARKNVKVMNYQLVNFLKLEDGTEFDRVDLAEINSPILPASEDNAITHRSDLKAVEAQHDVALNHVKIIQAANYPTLFATGGYTAMDVKNVITVKNAMNIGVGVSYNLSALYKNKRDVNVARNRVREVEDNMRLLNDQIKVEVQQANENYKLAKAQDMVYGEAVNQANENFRIVKDKYDNGVADTDDLLEADVQQLQSRINQAIGKANTVERYYDLLFTNGQLIQK
ncbi:TolC family protein [Sphingobacterium sp. SYP-B4668]|uniref:TolC family protein n=1 Tax=Sphingobacterium sp. SYP-B4668 TaxID=2996035 RepID=UPI0022DD774E|nr:TolC family protein [Sphingobacterium sp. SYP-B4668]